MTEQTVSKPATEADEVKTWKRRGLLAAAWAAVVAIMAKQTTVPVEAGIDGDVVLAGANTETTATTITNTTGNSTALNLVATSGTGLYSEGANNGVRGFSDSMTTEAAVLGETPRAGRAGVWGMASMGVGVRGSSVTGFGILGEISTYSYNTIAIYGVNNSSYTGPSPGAGGFAIYGLCTNGHGLVGATAAAGAAAVVGATNGVAGAYAGVFFGPVVVEGDFTVVGGAKSAAVPHPDGSHRRLYCLESPESWFEDFGEGQLACGEASITVDSDFAAVADLSKYHVFLTGYDGQSDLSVCKRTSSGFQVRAKDDASSGAFSWRVVAKRKDLVSERLATITIPPEPQLPTPPPCPNDPTSWVS